MLDTCFFLCYLSKGAGVKTLFLINNLINRQNSKGMVRNGRKD